MLIFQDESSSDGKWKCSENVFTPQQSLRKKMEIQKQKKLRGKKMIDHIISDREKLLRDTRPLQQVRNQTMLDLQDYQGCGKGIVGWLLLTPDRVTGRQHCVFILTCCGWDTACQFQWWWQCCLIELCRYYLVLGSGLGMNGVWVKKYLAESNLIDQVITQKKQLLLRLLLFLGGKPNS